jgi:hypothetical protein
MLVLPQGDYPLIQHNDIWSHNNLPVAKGFARFYHTAEMSADNFGN